MSPLKSLMLVALLTTLSAPVLAADATDGNARTRDIVKVGPDTYSIHRAEKPFVSHATIKQSMRDDAKVFAVEQGKVAVPVSFKENTRELNQFYTAYTWDYTFRLADQPGAQAASAPTAAPTPPAATAAPVVAGATPAPAAQPATPVPPVAQAPSNRARRVDVLYEQLLKLDDLRKKGILTEAEFQSEKKKLLDAN